jgi:hypothetical protein
MDQSIAGFLELSSSISKKHDIIADMTWRAVEGGGGV